MHYSKRQWRYGGFVVLALVGCHDEGSTEVNQIRERTSAALETFDSCEDLLTSLRTHAQEEMQTRLLQAENRWLYLDDAVPGADKDEGTGSGDVPRQEGVDFSGTNNQEAGVDEADIVKTDGYFLYVLNGDRLEIFATENPGDLEHVSTTTVEGYPTQMLLGDGKVAVFSSVYPGNLPVDHPLRQVLYSRTDEYGNVWFRSNYLSKITVYNVEAADAPVVERQLYIEGFYQTARRVEDTVRLVAYSYMELQGLQYWPDPGSDYWALDYNDPQREVLWNIAVLAAISHNNDVIAAAPLSDFVPDLYEVNAAGNLVEHAFTGEACQNFAAAEDAVSRGFTSILSLNLLDADLHVDADHIVSNYSTVYSSLNTLIIAEPSQDWWWYWDNESFDEATNVHRFDISEPGVTRYTGSGRVDGTLLGQFALSEKDSDVRVASTTGEWNRWWETNPAAPENHVFVLRGDEALEVVGHVDGIGVGERLWSARFDGDTAYLVTFRNIDPLWTIDLSDPTNPTVLGELEVPGVSTYIHPVDNHLLTIGYGGDDSGLNWQPQVSLFDVSDLANPVLADSLNVTAPAPADGWSYSYSEATWEHKAFTLWHGLLAIPVSSYRSGGYVENYAYEYRSYLQLVEVDTATGALSSYGQIDHSEFFNSASDYYWSYRDVRRSVFMGDFVYAISDRGITATNVIDMSLSAQASLPGTYTEYGYYY